MLTYLSQHSLAFGRPWWLIAIPLILPPLVWFSRKSLAGLGGPRRAMAILFRTAVLLLLILALAQTQSVRKNDRLTTIFLVDNSQSIPHDWQPRMLEFINAANKAQKRPDDLSGVIVFGKDARVEQPPNPNPGPLMGIENPIDGENTDLGGAIKLALASFPEETARRLVILSDGNENRGNAMEQALAARGLNVQIDVLPIEYHYDREVLVEKVSVPPDVKKGETVNINVVIRASEPTRGRLQIFQRSDNTGTPVGDAQPQEVELRRGINVLTLKKTITEPNFYTFSAEFIPDRDSGDRRAINNRAEGFTQARGEAHVLLIEGTAGEHVELVQALREKKIEVTVMVAPKVDSNGIVAGDPLPTDMAQLQPYDAVILGNVPKDSLTEEQQELLERNVHDFGAGLVMLGGPNSFGAGGWMNTPIEKALPVEMQIKATRVMGKSALVMIMHASEIPEGNYWQKKVAQEALKTLSGYDYAGMVHWEGQEAWLFAVQPIGSNKSRMLRTIDAMTPGDMPDFDPSLQMAVQGLRRATDAMTKHIIIISDGDPTPPTPQVIRQLVANKITVTAVLVAAHGGDSIGLNAMQNLAQKTKGRFYNVTNPKALPRIYQKEARLISRPLIFERSQPWVPKLAGYTEPIFGLPQELPGITGLVQATVKENELVEVPLTSPLPTGTGQVNPLLAHWTYGLGRAVAFTSDAGRRWTTAWVNWEQYGAFWSQVIRWAMRPVDRGNLTMTLRREGGQIRVVVDALDKDDQFLNFLNIQGRAVRPDLMPESVSLVQTAPGRYEGTVERAEARGNYFVTLGYRTPEGATGVLSSGVSVPYSDEYRELRSNPTTLESIASVTGGRGASADDVAWKFRKDGRTLDLDRTLSEIDVFRRDPKLTPPKSFTDLWPPLLWLAACLFLGDVAVRRIAPDLDRMRSSIARGWRKLRGQEVAPPTDYMEKLKGRKAEVADQIDRTRAATRFEAPPLPEGAAPVVNEPLLTGGDPSAADRPKPPPESRPGLGVEPKSAQPESYAERLLKAKQKVWEDREKEKG
jgi:uncharacterized membrane protein/Mg-chelatase subunit ChlD